MVAIIALIFCAYMMSIWIQETHLVLNGYIITSLVTVLSAHYECQIVIASAMGTCQSVSALLGYIAQNMGVTFVTFILVVIPRYVIKKRIERV